MAWQWTPASRDFGLQLLSNTDPSVFVNWINLFNTFHEQYPNYNGDKNQLKSYLVKYRKQVQQQLQTNNKCAISIAKGHTQWDWTLESLSFLNTCFNNLSSTKITITKLGESLHTMFLEAYPDYPFKPITLYRFAKSKWNSEKRSEFEDFFLTQQMKQYLLDTYNTTKSSSNKHNIANKIHNMFVGKFPSCNLKPHELHAEAVFQFYKLKCLMPSLESPSQHFNAKWSTNCNSVLLHIITLMKQKFKTFNSVEEEELYVNNEFRRNWPRFTGSNEIISNHYFSLKPKIRTPNQNWTLKNIDENMLTLNNVANTKSFTEYRILGQRLSRNPIFNYSCHNCGFLFEVYTGQTNNNFLRIDKPMCDPPRVVAIYSASKIQFPPFITPTNKYVTCQQCFGGNSVHSIFPLANENKNIAEIPKELRRLSPKEIGLISLSGVYSNIVKHNNTFRRVFEHRQGKVEIGNRSLQKYAEILMYYNLQPQSDANPNYIVAALQWLRAHNHLYAKFYSNYETLIPWLSNSKIPVNAYDIITYKGNFEEFVGKDTEGIAILAENITVDPSNYPRDRVYGIQHPKDALSHVQATTRVSYNDPDLEARAFPKEFPFGIGSFNNVNGGMDPQTYVKSRLKSADPRWRNNNSFAFMWLNKLIVNRLIYYNKVGRVVQQHNLENPLTVADVSKNDNKIGSIVPTTIPGSKNYWNAKVLDLVAATQSFGKADLFVTLTHNDNWYEIQSALGSDCISDDCTGFDKPAKNLDPSNSVPLQNVLAFVKRLKVFKQKFLPIGKRGPFGIVKHFYIRYEYQKRGALHAHILIWVYENTLPEDVVVAEFPRVLGNLSDDAEVQHLRSLVTAFQIHSCYPERCHRISKGKYIKSCKYGFPFHMQDNLTMDKNQLRYQYPRSAMEDLLVVPHNRQLLLLWGGHINVQLTTNVHFEKYLAKYVAKCEPSVKAKGKHDDTERFLNYRTMGILECITTLLQYHQSQSSFKVIFLPTEFCPRHKMLKRNNHLPSTEDSTNIYYDNKFEKYLNRPNSLAFLRYENYFQQYEIAATNPIRTLDSAESDDNDLCFNSRKATQNYLIDNSKRQIRKRLTLAVTRYQFILPYGQETERFYEQKLCLSFPWTLNDINGNQFRFSSSNVTQTYMEECCIRGIVNSEEDAMSSITSAMDRGFNVSRVFQIAKQMVCHKLITEEKMNAIIEPLLNSLGIQDIDEVLQDNSLESCNSLVDLFRNIPAYEKVDEYKSKMNNDQRQSLEWFEQQINTGNQILAICSGSGGVGKSFLLNALTVLCRNKKLIVAVTATTGAAAYLIGGTTLHSFLKVNYDMQCCVQHGTTEALLLKDTDVVIVDEFSMLDNEMFILLDDTLRKFSDDPHKMFGNKSVVCFGDPGQLEAIRQSLFCNPMIQKFSILVLHEVVRQQDIEFAALMNRMRLAKNTKTDFDLLLTRSIHPSAIDTTTDFIIICALRDEVKQWNDFILSKLEAPVFKFVAQDRVNGLHPNYVEEQLIKRCCKYRMDDVLTLKPGCIVILTKNIDVDAGWANGTRCRVVSCNNESMYVIVESLRDGSRRPITAMSQKLSFTAGDGDYKFITRIQIPLRIGYSTTVHSVQGSTLDCNVYVQLNSSFWASGQAYVACSRVKTIDQLFFLHVKFETIICDPYISNLIDWMNKVNIIQHSTPHQHGNFPLQPLKVLKQYVPVTIPISTEQIVTTDLPDCTVVPLQLQKRNKQMLDAIPCKQPKLDLKTQSRHKYIKRPRHSYSSLTNCPHKNPDITSLLLAISNLCLNNKDTKTSQLALENKLLNGSDNVKVISIKRRVTQSANYFDAKSSLKMSCNTPVLKRNFPMTSEDVTVVCKKQRISKFKIRIKFKRLHQFKCSKNNNSSPQLTSFLRNLNNDDSGIQVDLIESPPITNLLVTPTLKRQIGSTNYKTILDSDAPPVKKFRYFQNKLIFNNKSSILTSIQLFCNEMFNYINTLLPHDIHKCSLDIAISCIQSIRSIYDLYKDQMNFISDMIKLQELHLYTNQNVDSVSCMLLPHCLKQIVCPISTLGDGNCLYRAFSWTLFGCENYFQVLKLLEAFNLLYQTPVIWNSANQEHAAYSVLQCLKNYHWAGETSASNLGKIVNRPIHWYSTFPNQLLNETNINVVSEYLQNKQYCQGIHHFMLADISHIERQPISLHYFPIRGQGQPNHFVALLQRSNNAFPPQPFRGYHFVDN